MNTENSTNGAETSTKRLDLDTVGMFASITCALHCALMPLLVSLLPLLGLSFLTDARTEWLLIGFSLLLGVTSLCLGFRLHRRRIVFGIFAFAVVALIAGRNAEATLSTSWGAVLMVIGGLSVATAHFINRKLCHSCRVCHPKEG